MKKISAFAFLGGKKEIDAAEFTFRPSVYAVIFKDDLILVAKTKRTGKYALPGGGADYEDDLEIALKREVKEETGLAIKVREFVYFNANYFYYDPMHEAFDSYQYFYLCEALTLDLAQGNAVDDYEAGDPEWLTVTALTTGNFQGVEIGILPVIKKIWNEKNNT